MRIIAFEYILWLIPIVFTSSQIKWCIKNDVIDINENVLYNIATVE